MVNHAVPSSFPCLISWVCKHFLGSKDQGKPFLQRQVYVHENPSYAYRSELLQKENYEKQHIKATQFHCFIIGSQTQGDKVPGFAVSSLHSTWPYWHCNLESKERKFNNSLKTLTPGSVFKHWRVGNIFQKLHQQGAKLEHVRGGE